MRLWWKVVDTLASGLSQHEYDDVQVRILSISPLLLWVAKSVNPTKKLDPFKNNLAMKSAYP